MTKAEYQIYLEAKKSVTAMEREFYPRAREIVKALHNQDATRFWYGETKVLYSCDLVGGNTFGPDGDFPTELLFDPDWKLRIEFMVHERMMRHEAYRLKCAEGNQKAERERDIAELKRLQDKYPEVKR